MTKSSFLSLQGSLADALAVGFPAADIAPIQLHVSAAVAARTNDATCKSAVDQAFRDHLFRDVIGGPAERIGPFVDYAIAACRAELAGAALPVSLMSDIFDVMPLAGCEQLFAYVEDTVAVWRESWMFAACKNNLLRMCNDLLRRLSRSQNTVFCGRILLFLAKFFPFSERSGLNVVSEFNLENLTQFEASAEDGTADDGPDEVTAPTAMPAAADAAEKAVRIDRTLYRRFWALQDFFRNPNQCYSPKQWETFAAHASYVLSTFDSFKLEEPRTDTTAAATAAGPAMDVDGALDQDVRESQHFFAKFLTNPKLLALQLSDSNFRRSVLVQFLILFQYLRSTVKFKAETFSLTAAQSDYIRDTDVTIYRLLDETPPNGQKFAATVRHMLDREQMWNNWKNDGCKEFSRPTNAPAAAPASADVAATAAPPKPALSGAAAAAKRQAECRLGDLVQDSIAQKRFYMGCPELTRLWNICPDNLQACRGDDRNFLPSIESYLENPKDKTDPSFEWRALRLLARQSPHFFSLTQTPNKVSDYLEGVRKKIHESKSKAAALAARTNGAATGSQQARLDARTTAASAAAAAASAAAAVAAAAAATIVSVDEESVDAADEAMSAAAVSAAASNEDDHNTHRIAIVTAEQKVQVAAIIGTAWRRVATKIGYTPDVLQFIDDKPGLSAADKCLHMLGIWFDEDEDASLDNLAYMLEGLELVVAADAIKRILEPADKMDDVSE